MRLALCAQREESLILSESAGKGCVSVFPLPSRYTSISSRPLKQLHIYMGRFFSLFILKSFFRLHSTLFPYASFILSSDLSDSLHVINW